MALPVAAQKKGEKGGKATKVVKPVAHVETSGQKLFKSMLPSTAKVMFIDSVVVSKADFLSRVPLNKESGSLTARKGKVGHGGVPLTQYQNDFGDRRIYAEGDTTATHLLAQTLVGKQWSAPHPLAGLDGNEYPRACFPFLASDGVTLFFAAQGPHSMGGYDIFMSRKDFSTGEYLNPQNIGFPYNSPYDDYMFVIDEMTGIGWWATDRNQIPDKVTIYMFKRNDVRENYDSDNDNIYSLAALRDIKATWADDADHASLKESIESISADTDKPDDEFVFYVMNGVRYTRFDNFQSSEARSLMEKRVALASQLADDKTELKRLRAAYANAKPAARKKMEQSILQLEHKVSDATKTLANIDNNIRSAEQSAIYK